MYDFINQTILQNIRVFEQLSIGFRRCKIHLPLKTAVLFAVL